MNDDDPQWFQPLALDYFAGGVPTGFSFRAILDDLQEANINFSKGQAINRLSELCLVGALSYFEAFCKDHAASIIGIVPELTHGALAQLSGYRRTSVDDWFGNYMIEAEDALAKRLDRRIAVPSQLGIWPDAQETPLRPPADSRRQLLRTELPQSGFERSVRDVVLVNQLLWKSGIKWVGVYH